MDEGTDSRPRFVPVRRSELLGLLAQQRDDAADFAHAAKLLHHVLRFEADEEAERLQATYEPFDPDPLAEALGDDDQSDLASFLETLERVLTEANYRRVTDEELQQAFDERSLFPLQASVDPDAYDVLRLYRRGESEREERVRSLGTLWRWRPHRVQLFDRLVVVLRLKPEALRDKQGVRTQGMEPGRIYLKTFKNVPKADVEMVLPNVRLHLRPLDRLLVGGALVGGVGWTLYKSIATIVDTLRGVLAWPPDTGQLTVLAGPALVLAGYLWRTHNKIKTRRLQYMQTLSQGLYFRNLANNRTVLHQVREEARDEEEKETLLAYHFLTKQGPLSERALDRAAEWWIRERTGRETNFDVEDGLGDLQRLHLVDEQDGSWQAVDPREAARRLDARWDSAWSDSGAAPTQGDDDRTDDVVE